VWSNEGVEVEAGSVYEVVQAVGTEAEVWVIALALLLGDLEQLRRYKASHAEVRTM
jgi:hypothetical protein